MEFRQKIFGQNILDSVKCNYRNKRRIVITMYKKVNVKLRAHVMYLIIRNVNLLNVIFADHLTSNRFT